MDFISVFLQKISDAQLWTKDIQLERNEYLTVKGKTDTNLYYIVSGSMKIYFEDEYEEQILRLGYTNNFIAALDSYISEQPTNLYVQALKKCELKVLPKLTFLHFLESDPALALMWQQLLGQLIYQQIEREIDVLTYSPKKRYQRVLARSPQLFQEIPSKYIASYLRMSPETLSRLKKS